VITQAQRLRHVTGHVESGDMKAEDLRLPAAAAGLRTGTSFKKGAKASGPVSQATYNREMGALARSKTAVKPTKQIPMPGRGVNELKIVKPNPKDTKGIKRSDMPQVSKKDYPEFFEYLKSNGATFEMQRDIPANTFKSTQGEFSDAGVERSMTKLLKGAKKKPIIVSQDNYIIDGHHRWLVAMNLGNSTVDTIKISMDADELLALVKAFNKTSYKDIYSEKIDKFNKDEPNKSTVAVPGYGTMNIDSLMKNVIDQTTQMLTQMKQGTQGFRNANYALNSNKVLAAKVGALVQALDDLQSIRSKGGSNSRNIQQEAESDNELPVDENAIMSKIQEFESQEYVTPEDADFMRRAVQSLTSGRQTINPRAILQLLTLVS